MPITDEDIVKLHGLIPALAAALRPPTPLCAPSATTFTTPDGNTHSLADYRDSDIVLDVDVDRTRTRISAPADLLPLKAGVDGSWYWTSYRNYSWGSMPSFVVTRVACADPTAIVVLTYRDTPITFTGPDLVYGRQLVRAIDMRHGFSWFVTADKPTRVILGGILLPAA